MKKVLLCFVSDDTKFLETALETLDRQQNGIELVDSVAISDIPKVDVEACDIILAVGAKEVGMSEVTEAFQQMNLPDEKLLGDWIVCIPGFTLEKYRKLQRSRLSIFSRNCFAGVISNALGLPFRSPTVNLTISDEDFIRFMRAPRVYMEEELIFSSKKFNAYDGHDIATFICGNIPVVMNHYPNFDLAKQAWERRKTRINWYNLFVTMTTNNPDVLQKFDELPFGKKICFVPFKSDLDSAYYVNTEKGFQSNPNIKRETVDPEYFTWEIVNRSALDLKFFYDPFDMLLYGKKTPVIEM